MAEHTFKDPAGQVVTLRSRGGPSPRLWQSQMTITTPMDGRLPDSLHTRTLTVTHRDNHDAWLAEREASLTGEYSLSSGTLQIWSPKDPEAQGLARWTGEHHAASVYLPFRQWESHSTVLAYFDGVDLEDSSIGLEARSTITRNTVSVLDVSAVVTGLGLLEVLAPAAGLSAIPAWRGLTVRAGEVWKATDAENPELVTHLVMASPRAVATITPYKTSGLGACLDFFKQLDTIDYRKAS